MSLWKRLLGRPVEAALGAPADASQGGQAIAFTLALVVLGVELARADGTVSRKEVETFKRVFRIAPADMDSVVQMFDQARQDTVDFRIYARQALKMFRDRPEVLEQLLDGLFAMAHADGVFDERELAVLRLIATSLEIGDGAFARIRARHERIRDPYAVLGVDRGIDEQSLRLAHHRLSGNANPDLLVDKGLPREFLLLAHEKAAAITEAFERICRDKGYLPETKGRS
jgi:DnaJ like chaperone protein